LGSVSVGFGPGSVGLRAASVGLGTPAAGVSTAAVALAAAVSFGTAAAAAGVVLAAGLASTAGAGAWASALLEANVARLLATAPIEGRSDGCADSMCISSGVIGPARSGGSNVPAATRCISAMEF
jgi:hypothetical protein